MAVPLLAASVPAVVWLVVGLCATVAVLAVTVALVRHLLVLVRSLRRFGDEIAPVARAIGEDGAASLRPVVERSRRPARRPLRVAAVG